MKLTVKEDHSLHIAAAGGDVFSVRTLLDQGTDINTVDDSGHTALHHAIWAGHLETAHLLIEHGASIKGTTVNQNWAGIDPDTGVEARLQALELLEQATRAMEW